MKNLSLGLKITLGFALLIVIAAALGIMAIWRMGDVESQSAMLAHEYVPEVDVAVELRGGANRLMFEMRGYGFTEDKKFYDRAQTEIENLDATLAKARALEAKSPHLTALKGQIETATKAMATYKTLIQETVSIQALMDGNRKKLEDAAGIYMGNSEAFVDGQNAKLKTDLAERQKKIQIVSKLVHLGTRVRVGNFKAQATRDAALFEKAVAELDRVPELLNELREITRDKADIQRISATQTAAQKYENAMKQFLVQFNKGAAADPALLNKYRGQMDENADIYVKNCDEFLDGQQKKLTDDMLERTEKVTIANDIIDLGNETRVGTAKSQALRSPEVMKTALANFPRINEKFAALEKITFLEEDLKRIQEVKEAAQAYEAAMTGFLDNWTKLQELGLKRTEAGNRLIEACKITADAGMKATDKIAKEAVSALSAASTIMVIGLIVALVVGVLCAIFITRSITKPVNKIIAGLNEGSNQVASASGQVSSSSQSKCG